MKDRKGSTEGDNISPDLEHVLHNFRHDRVTYLPTASLNLSDRRLRKRKNSFLETMKISVKQFGIVLPLLIDANSVVIAGEGVLEAAKSLGYKEVPTLRIEHLDEVQVRLLRIALNRMSEHSEWDKIELQAEFTELMSLDVDMALEVSGFSSVEIDQLVFAPAQAAEPDPDEVPYAIGAAGSEVARTGDIFDLGDHTVLCGSSLESEIMQILMGGKQARMVLTDAPYNLASNEIGNKGKIKHADFKQASGEMSEAEFIEFLTTSMQALAASCMDGALLYMYMDHKHMWEMLSAIRACGLQMINLAVWVKQSGGMGSHYRSQHELVFIARKGKTQHKNNIMLGKFGRTRTNCWMYPGMNSFGTDRDELLTIHPTCKNVTMLSDAIRDATDRGEIVVDGFLGSGSTLIAAERTGRICRGVELDPLYVDAIIHRWEKATNRSAVLRATGETFAQLAERRASELPLSVPPSERVAALHRPELAPRPRIRTAA